MDIIDGIQNGIGGKNIRPATYQPGRADRRINLRRIIK